MRIDIKNKWLFLFWIYTIFIIYGTTLPFNFTASGQIILNHTNSILSTIKAHNPLYRSYKYDVISNILFFIPFGFFLFNALIKRLPKDNSKLIFFKITSFGFLLSSLVETIQIFTIDRNPSISDVIMNTIGTIVGIISGYLLLHFNLRIKLQKIMRNLIKNPDRIILSSYLFFLLIAGLIPFDVTIDPSNIIRNLKILDSLPTISIKNPRNLFNLIFVWGTAGYIISRYLKKRWQETSYLKQTFFSIFSGFSYVLFIEILQLFVVTQKASFIDVFVSWLGVFYGIATYQLFHWRLFSKNNHNKWQSFSDNKNIFYFILFNYIIFVLYKYIYPFKIDFSSETIEAKLLFFFFSANSYVPDTKIILLLKIAIKNIALFLPAGIILKEADFKWPKLLSNSLVKLLLTLNIVLLLKSVQFFNATQTPYFFDFVGISIGITIGYVFWKDFKSILIKSKNEIINKKSDGVVG
jgi:glycopeptide antibiotics resistance protein